MNYNWTKRQTDALRDNRHLSSKDLIDIVNAPGMGNVRTFGGIEKKRKIRYPRITSSIPPEDFSGPKTYYNRTKELFLGQFIDREMDARFVNLIIAEAGRLGLTPF